MRSMMKILTMAAALLAATLGVAAAAEKEVHQLRPATPQPNPEELVPGLAVEYAYPGGVRSLVEAHSALSSAEPGPPLVGFDYPNTMPGENALTAKRATMVAARIEGYIRFDQAGEYELGFLSNDGLQVALGGTRIYRWDFRMPCAGGDNVKVNVPRPGYYRVAALFFQRYKTSCLLMKMKKPGATGMTWAPTDIYFHKP